MRLDLFHTVTAQHIVGVGVPAGSSAIVDASQWIEGVLLGPIATSLAIIAVALLGFAMLMGRINMRRAISVLMGCFLLFGAKGIAEGLRSFGAIGEAPPMTNGPAPLVYPSVSKTHENNINAFDPYAGATVVTPDK